MCWEGRFRWMLPDSGNGFDFLHKIVPSRRRHRSVKIEPARELWLGSFSQCWRAVTLGPPSGKCKEKIKQNKQTRSQAGRYSEKLPIWKCPSGFAFLSHLAIVCIQRKAQAAWCHRSISSHFKDVSQHCLERSQVDRGFMSSLMIWDFGGHMGYRKSSCSPFLSWV